MNKLTVSTESRAKPRCRIRRSIPLPEGPVDTTTMAHNP